MCCLAIIVLICCILTISDGLICPEAGVLQQKDLLYSSYKTTFEQINPVVQINDSTFRSSSLSIFTEKLDELFSRKDLTKDQMHNNLMKLLENIYFDKSELSPYINFDHNYAYTRNL